MADIKQGGRLIATNVNPELFFAKLRADGLSTEDYDVLRSVNELAAERKQHQLNGILFDGVMCSATGDDQAGLSALLLKHTVLKLNGLQLPDIHFRFENGNVLTINSDNIEALDAVWTPFRLSFFPPQ